jgi:hypothetical protein
MPWRQSAVTVALTMGGEHAQVRDTTGHDGSWVRQGTFD